MGVYSRRLEREGSSSGGSFGLPSGGGATLGEQALAATGLDPETGAQGDQHRPEGFFGKIAQFGSNAIGDLGEFVGGGLHLAGLVGSDIVKGADDLLEQLPGSVLGGKDENKSYQSDDLARETFFDPSREGARQVLPGFQDYFKDQYGLDLIKGDLWPEKLPTAAYEDPLGTVLDVYGGANIVGKGVGRAAVNKASKVLDAGGSVHDLSGLTKKILPGLDPDQNNPLFDAERLDRTTGRKVGDKDVRAGGYRPRILEVGEYDIDPVTEIGLNINPVRRGVGTAMHKLITQDIDEAILPNIRQLADEIKKARNPDEFRRASHLTPEQFELARLYNAARDAGVQRIDHKWVAQHRATSAARRYIAHWTANTYLLRNQDRQRIIDLFKEHDKRLRANGYDQPTIDRLMRDAHKYLEGVVAVPGVARRSVQESRQWLQQNAAMIDDPKQLAEITKRFDELEEYQTGRMDEFQVTQQDLAAATPGTDEYEKLAEHLYFLADEVDATQRHGRHLSEIIGVLENSTADETAVLMAKLRMERQNLVHKSVMQDKLSYRDMMRRQYAPRFLTGESDDWSRLRAADDAVGDASLTRDPVTGALSDEDMKKFYGGDATSARDALFDADADYWRRIDDDFETTGKAAPVYFPQMDPEKFNRGSMLLKRSRVAMGVSRGLGFDANKYYNFAQGRYLTDPMQAYAFRAAHMRRVVETSDFVGKFAHTYGRKVASANDVAPGEVVFNPWALKQRYKSRALMDEAIEDTQLLGKEADNTAAMLANGLKNVKVDTSAIASMTPDQISEMWALPKHVADKLEAYSNFQIGEMGKMFFDRPMDFWRNTVLALSPRWIANNLFGNVVFLKMQGGKLSDVFRSWTSEEFRRNLDEIIEQLPDDIRGQVDSGMYQAENLASVSLGAGQATPAGAHAAAKIKDSTKAGAKGVYGAHQSAVKFMQEFNQHLENHFRRASFVSGIERTRKATQLRRAGLRMHTSMRTLEDIAQNGLDEGIARKAIDEMNYFFNDYRALAPLERNVLRRVMPFYSFYKHTAKLTVSYPFVGAPERAAIFKMLGEISRDFNEDRDQDWGDLAPWMQGAQELGEGAEEGEGRFLNPRNWIPMAGFVESIREPQAFAGQLGPIGQVLGETITGEDALGRPLTSADAYRRFGDDQAFKPIYDNQGNIIDYEETKVRRGLLETVLGSVPQYDLIRDAIAASPVGGGQAYERYSTGEENLDKPTSFGRQALGFLSGLSMSDFDPEVARERLLAQKQAAAIAHARAMGLLPEAE